MRKNLSLKKFATFLIIIYCICITNYIKTNSDITLNISEKNIRSNKFLNKSNCIPKGFFKKIKDNIVFKSTYLRNEEKRKLSNSIISNYLKQNTNNKLPLFINFEEILYIIDYISDADEVAFISQKELSLPIEITRSKKVFYSAKYGAITNYYSKDGELICREYKINNEPYRYQSYDQNNNFYTYDKNFKLIEYSDKLKVYNANRELLFIAGAVSEKFSREHKYMFTDFVRTKFIKELNNKDSELYKSITTAIDEHYNKGSYDEMTLALNEYFSKIRISQPDIYKNFLDAIGDVMTINFAKTDDGYIFSANQIYVKGIEKLIHSMASSINIYRGRCAETSLKVLSGNKIPDKYFYDIKLQLKNEEINSKEHRPCNTCARNISLWGWRYPKNTATDNKKNKTTF